MRGLAPAWLAILSVACSYRPPVEVPGFTDSPVLDVSIVAADGGDLELDYGTLKDTLGLRKGSLIRPERTFNPYRLSEDRRRIETHAQLMGRFEAKVSEPQVDRDDSGVKVTWTVDEGPAYTIGKVEIVGAPDGTEPLLHDMVPFDKGSGIEILAYRPLRRELAERLQYEGYGHARVYSRAWVDNQTKTVDWFYFVDAGPKTTIKSIEVAGNVRVPKDVILSRAGLVVGGEYSTKLKKRAELALLDGGSLRSIVVRHDADILTGPPQWPDSGGTPVVDDNGDMVPRDLDPEINVRLVVVEAPRRELRVEVGAEADPARLDAFAGMRALFRDVLAARNHIVLEGRIGYGWELGDTEQPTGLYGEALARYVRAGLGSEKIDARISGRLRHQLFPGTASWRELAAGPGLRSVLADNLFFDLDVLMTRSEELEFGPFDDATRDALSLADDDIASGLKVESSLILDKRNDRIEALRGHLIAATAELSPGGALGSHRWFRLGGDVRKMFPLSPKLSIAARASASWVLGADDSGVPLGARLFGGGSYGFRGAGRQELSPIAMDERVGGSSLAEASLEARFLPFRQLYGAVAFLDFGGVGIESNPLEDGISSAFGLGLRARTYYVPVSIDVSYRFLETGDLVGPGDIDRWGLFFRIGEAF